MRGYGSYKKAGMRFARQSARRGRPSDVFYGGSTDNNTTINSDSVVIFLVLIIFATIACVLLSTSL